MSSQVVTKSISIDGTDCSITFAEDVFTKNIAVVNEGTTGIGPTTAQYLAEHGAKVYVLGLNRADVYTDAPCQVASSRTT